MSAKEGPARAASILMAWSKTPKLSVNDEKILVEFGLMADGQRTEKALQICGAAALSSAFLRGAFVGQIAEDLRQKNQAELF